MLFNITLTSKSLMKSDNCYVEAPDFETADCFAEMQADSYGCTYSVSTTHHDEIPDDADITDLTGKYALFTGQSE